VVSYKLGRSFVKRVRGEISTRVGCATRTDWIALNWPTASEGGPYKRKFKKNPHPKKSFRASVFGFK